MDQSLPGMDGLTLVHEMKNHTPTADIPIILLTNGKRWLTPEEAEQGEPEAMLAKPFRPVSLLNTIYRCLKIGSGA